MYIKRITKWLVARRRKLVYAWEHYVMPEFEIASAALVMVVDTFRWIAVAPEHSLVIHQIAASGCIAFMVIHLIRRYAEYREHHHPRKRHANIHFTAPIVDRVRIRKHPNCPVPSHGETDEQHTVIH